MLAQPATLGGFCPASATLTSLVGGLKTMSPAPGRRPPILALFLAKVSFLRRKTNITQAPGQDSRWAPHSGREDTTRRTGTEAGVGGRDVWCPGEGRGRGRCVTSEEVRLDRPASELADCGRPHASRGAALLERGGPLRGGGGEGRGLPLVFGSMSGSRAVRCGVGLRGEAARRVGLRGGACAKGAMRRPHVHAYIRCTYSPFSRV